MNTVIKRVVCGFLAFLVLLVSVIIPDFSSFADESSGLTVGEVLIGYTENDLLTDNNYLNNYDQVSEYLKYCVNEDIYLHNGFIGSNFLSEFINFYNTSTNMLNAQFYDNSGKKSISFFMGPSYTPCAALTNTPDDVVIINGVYCCDHSFEIKWCDYSVSTSGSSTYLDIWEPYYYGGDFKHTRTATLDNNTGLYIFDCSNYNFIYSENDFYFTFVQYANYPDGDYLGQSPYNYQYYNNVYNAIGSDQTGFVIDRRTEKMINGDDSEDDLLNDVDLMQFEGDLGFEYFDFKGYITENQGLIFPNYIVNYKLNNYTDLRKENIEIYADYSFDFKLTFQMAGNQMYGYQSANMGTMGFMDMLPVNQNTYGMDLNAYMDDNTFVNYRETSGLHLQSNGIRDYENIQNFNQNSMIADFGRYFYKIMNNVSANKVVNSKRDSYFYITCEFWIEYVDENGRRIQSNKIVRKIDYWGDSSDPSSNLTPVVTDIDSSGIIDDDQAYHDFIDSYNYKKINDVTDGYLNYLPSTSNNSNQSSVGDITIYQNPYPYVLVDIPENQWLNNTPNLKTLLTDFKTMLAETKEGSILNFFPEVYNYFPVPVWNYLLYGIGICIMIGIWRGITRR